MIIALVGESASGKSTIEKEIVKLGYSKITSYTTRKPRHMEVDGDDYHFITEDDFQRLMKDDFFAEIAVYNGWNYGTAKKDCIDDKVIVVSPHGLRQLKKNKNLNIVSFYINVPRRDRLIKILQRGDSIDESIRRSLSDVGQYDGLSDEVDFVIDNEGYSKTPREIATIVHVLVNQKDGE